MGILQSSMQEAAAQLRAGNPVVFPTDTVYGLGVSVRHASSPAILFQIKGRPSDKPVAWLVGSVDELARYGKNVPDCAFDLARRFWPGPLTIIVPAADDVPSCFKSADGTIGLRMPDNATALQLLDLVGNPLATTSANLSGQPAPYCIEDIDEVLAERASAVVSDDLPHGGTSSTVILCSSGDIRVLREGPVSAFDVQSVCQGKA